MLSSNINSEQKVKIKNKETLKTSQTLSHNILALIASMEIGMLRLLVEPLLMEYSTHPTTSLQQHELWDHPIKKYRC